MPVRKEKVLFRKTTCPKDRLDRSWFRHCFSQGFHLMKIKIYGVYISVASFKIDCDPVAKDNRVVVIAPPPPHSACECQNRNATFLSHFYNHIAISLAASSQPSLLHQETTKQPNTRLQKHLYNMYHKAYF